MIPAVVLAAGKSTRMGRPKAALPLDDEETLASRVVRTLVDAGVDEIVVIVGHESEAVIAAVESRGLSPRFVRNDVYESGQLSSVLSGLHAIDRPGVTAMLLTLVDVPFVTADTVRAVLSRHRISKSPIVRPVQGDRHGHPILVDRALFPLLRAADPAQGIKPIVRAHASAAGDVVVEDEGAFVDVDTPEDYARVRRDFGR